MTTCTACANLARFNSSLKCNRHRVESLSSSLIRQAREAGHVIADGDWEAAEKALGARPVYAN